MIPSTLSFVGIDKASGTTGSSDCGTDLLRNRKKRDRRRHGVVSGRAFNFAGANFSLTGQFQSGVWPTIIAIVPIGTMAPLSNVVVGDDFGGGSGRFPKLLFLPQRLAPGSGVR